MQLRPCDLNRSDKSWTYTPKQHVSHSPQWACGAGSNPLGLDLDLAEQFEEPSAERRAVKAAARRRPAIQASIRIHGEVHFS